MKNYLFERIKISTILPFMLFVVSPSTFYFGNLNEINFSLKEISLNILCIFLLFSCLFFLLYLIFYKSKTLSIFYSGILLGVSFCIWVQSQLFLWGFGPLDGRDLNWQPWRIHAVGECIVWTIIISFCIFLFWKNQKKFIQFLFNFTIGVGVISIFLSYFMSSSTASFPTKISTDQNSSVFNFHPGKNIVVIILDTFQSDYFEQIMQDFFEETSFLDGFTFYRNTISSYPTTAPNIPAILTNSTYDNQIDFERYKANAYRNFNLLDYFKENKYTVNYIQPSADLDSFYKDINAWSHFIDYGLFKASPIIFKKKIYNNGKWLSSFIFTKKIPNTPHGKDILFSNKFFNEARIDHRTSFDGTFKFIHYYTPHYPLVIDENLSFTPDLAMQLRPYQRQARGSLKLAKTILEKMRSLEIYDSSEIVIMSDHGTYTLPPVHSIGNESDNLNDQFSSVPLQVQSSGLQLLLHKRPNEKGKIKISDAPIQGKDLACLLNIQNDKLNCDSFNLALHGDNQKRIFYYYDWKHEYWKKQFMPPMTEYFIMGHAYDIASWQKGNFKYEEGKKNILTAPPKIKVGERVAFTELNKERVNEIIRSGWSMQETSHRWSDADKALLQIHLEKPTPPTKLFLCLNASAYLGKLDSQRINVVINGQQVASWEMKGKKRYIAQIPSSMVEEEALLNITFFISDPTAPCEVSNSKDCRKLGMAVYDFSVIDTDTENYFKVIIPEVNLGESLFFTETSNPQKFLKAGWSGQETAHRWTDGPEASILLPIHSMQNNDLILRLYANAYIGGGLTHQTIGVIVNGEQVASWKMIGKEWYEAKIPSSLVDNGLVKISFKISNPTAPCEVSDSKDCRKLGMAVRELILDSDKRQ
ncbi:LTA synthase family protein [Desulfococcaceae bacterium OttesenSCG-928-F15]|nr:LTA synthase family protein [Desulfococcaceae bacterium OttesenSCG-928-F15]